jgi:hypothetical protein
VGNKEKHMEDLEVVVIGKACFTKDGIILKVGIGDFLAIERMFGYIPTGPAGVPTLHKAGPLTICLTTIIPEPVED